MTVGGEVFRKGDVITIDGATGEVLKGRVKMRQPELSGDFAHLMGWADEARTPRRARQRRHAARRRARPASSAPRASACAAPSTCSSRQSRILAMREMICADDEAGRRTALAKMLPMQRADFEALFEIMAGLPVTIRLLDPPLHEFLPHEEKEAAAVAEELGVPLEKLHGRVDELHEFNPDARLPRLPPRHPLSRDHRDAGARHLRGGGQRRQARPASRSCRR